MPAAITEASLAESSNPRHIADAEYVVISHEAYPTEFGVEYVATLFGVPPNQIAVAIEESIHRAKTAPRYVTAQAYSARKQRDAFVDCLQVRRN